ncbi:MAG TPA: hypothetical protein VGG87_07780 [Solirubrobacteraceae bacterium]
MSRLSGRLALALAAICALLGAGLISATAARAGTVAPLITAEPAGTPVLVTSMNSPPKGFRLTAASVLAIAAVDPRVRRELRRFPGAKPYEYTKAIPVWQVSWFTAGRKQREVIQAYVDDRTGTVSQVWTGFQVPWSMARGYPGAFGRRSNALYVWLPLCFLFLAPFLPWRRGRTSRRRRLTLLHLDLVMLLGFSVSLAFFNHADVGLSVPLVYPFLLYVLVRMLLLAFGRGVPREPLAVAVPMPWLLSGLVFLLGLRIGLNIMNSNVIDVGYAGVIGSDKLIHGHLLYGLWPKDNAFGDTYGPLTYYAYVPFRLIFGWSGTWDSLPAAHAAAIAFDLLTTGLLYLLGRRLRGPGLGVVLAYAWAAYPFTLFTLSSNSNDALVSAAVVLCLLTLSSAPARGLAAALAGLTKFAPFALAPLMLRGVGRRPKEREVAIWIVVFAATLFVALQPVLLNGDLDFMWHDSIAYQANRVTPFSIWGLWGGLGIVQHVLEGGVAAMAILLALVPERRGPVEVAALGAAILVALQLTANYWLYPYILWFFPLVCVAVFASHPERLPEFGTQFETRVSAVAGAELAAVSEPAPLQSP